MITDRKPSNYCTFESTHAVHNTQKDAEEGLISATQYEKAGDASLFHKGDPNKEGESKGSSEGAFDLHDKDSVFKRLQVLFFASYPVVASLLLSVTGNCIVLYFAGRLSSAEGNEKIFSGVTLAITFANVTFCSIVDGLTTAVETLSSQYNGNRNFYMVGQTLHRSIIVLSLLSFATAFLWRYAESIFLSLNVDPETCMYMGQFLQVRILAMPCEICFLSYEKCLMSMGLMQPSMISGALYISTLFCAEKMILDWLDLELGVAGLAWALVVCSYAELIFVILLTAKHPSVQRTMHCPSFDSFKNLGEFLWFGIPGCVMVCAEWWAYELLIVFASLLGTCEVSSVSIIFQTMIICFMVPLGIGISASSMVGNALGEGKIDIAKQVAKLALASMATLSLVICPCIVMFGPRFMALYTTDATVIETTSSLVYVLSYSAFVDGMQSVSSGILRGAAKQFIGARTNVAAFYVIGLPCSWVLCFHYSLGVRGLLYGIYTGSTLQCCILVYVVLFQQERVFTRLEH